MASERECDLLVSLLDFHCPQTATMGKRRYPIVAKKQTGNFWANFNKQSFHNGGVLSLSCHPFWGIGDQSKSDAHFWVSQLAA